MRIVRDYQFIDPKDRGASVAIGNFDGVHLGHQAVIDVAREHADRLRCPLGVVTFEPHPREFFTPNVPAFRLMSAAAKAHRLEKLGVERLYELGFTGALSSLTAEMFAHDVLVHGLGLRHIVVGTNFHFGKNRTGTTERLRILGEELGFGVTVAKLVKTGELRVSSTSIRQALAEGRPEDAARMLGHWHRIEGPVIHGEKRGRELGYPTANMALTGLHIPRHGVYAALVDVLTGAHRGSYHGAASIGMRPMFGGDAPNLETFIFDFAGDLYGASLSVGLVEFLRPEQKFDSIETLVDQMRDDCAQAREILIDL